MQKKYIAIEWDEFSQDVLPFDASVEQISEMRKAFYAGATAMMHLMTRFATQSGSRGPTDADVRPIEEMEEELRQFAMDVAAGRIK